MISDFQLALIGIAVVVIVAVIVYNRWQESKYKKRAELAFGTSHPDVLIDDSLMASASPSTQPHRHQTGERVEPRLGANLPTYAGDDIDDLAPIGDAHSLPSAHANHESLITAVQYSAAPVLHADVDSIALILADAPLEAAQYENVITQSKLLGKGVRWEIGRASCRERVYSSV